MFFRAVGKLPGESDLVVINRNDSSSPFLLFPSQVQCCKVAVVVSNYRVVLRGECPLNNSFFDPYVIDIPLMMIESCKLSTRTTLHVLELQTKHVWLFKLGFSEFHVAASLLRIVESMFPRKLCEVPAFTLYGAWEASRSQKRNAGEAFFSNFGWGLVDVMGELERQLSTGGCSEGDSFCPTSKSLRSRFQVSDIQQPQADWGSSPSYPFCIVASSRVSAELLADCLELRSKGRIPSISWVHLGTGAILARASQPLHKESAIDGLLCDSLINSEAESSERLEVASSKQDCQAPNASRVSEMPPSLVPPATKLGSNLDYCDLSDANSGGKQRKTYVLHCVDCRPKAVAYAHRARGGGSEHGVQYRNCRVSYHDIPGTSVINAAFGKLRELVILFDGSSNSRQDFFVMLHDTAWVHYIQLVLSCAVFIAEQLQNGVSTLVHCTDGWDRTPQCVALAMLLLDPYFRTIRGFCTLIEREFCQMGHRFAERHGHHLPTMSKEDAEFELPNKCPIFMQFLDCVYQVLQQFPSYFEFSEELLIFLSIQSYSCYYGTFLCNSMRSRTFSGVTLRTLSIWTEVEQIAQNEREGNCPFCFINPNFMAQSVLLYMLKECNSGVWAIRPCVSSKRLLFWDSLYLRYDVDKSPYNSEIVALSPEASTACDPEYVKYLSADRLRLIGYWQDSMSRHQQLVKEISESLLVEVDQPPLKEKRGAVSFSDVFFGSGDTKCWNCQASFGMFSSRWLCCKCPEQQRKALCSQCVTMVKNQKLCLKCSALYFQP